MASESNRSESPPSPVRVSAATTPLPDRPRRSSDGKGRVDELPAERVARLRDLLFVAGGLEPDEVFKLMNDPEVMAMVQKPKFQEIMADVMQGGGPMTLQKHMADPESREMLMTLTKLLQNAGMVPPGASR